MDRRKFIRQCGYAALSAAAGSLVLSACNAIYYANFRREKNRLIVAKSAFIREGKNGNHQRQFVLLKVVQNGFPICLYRHDKEQYTAALLQCTHRGCELNVGGGIYTCPCHGSEFSIRGEVLQGPADHPLQLFQTTTDHENIFVYLS